MRPPSHTRKHRAERSDSSWASGFVLGGIVFGTLGFLFARIMGPDFAKGLPETVEKLARLAAQPMS